jgi:hypothetical protein
MFDRDEVEPCGARSIQTQVVQEQGRSHFRALLGSRCHETECSQPEALVGQIAGCRGFVQLLVDVFR